jgi:hypothetical protein
MVRKGMVGGTRSTYITPDIEVAKKFRQTGWMMAIFLKSKPVWKILLICEPFYF